MTYDISKVTPRPWQIGGTSHRIVGRGQDEDVCSCDFITAPPADGANNAAHIVHCVNHHEEMLAMVRRLANDPPELHAQNQAAARALLEKVKP